MVTLRQLQYLLAIQNTKNFVKAAKMCHVTQPTLSMQLQQLEENLGTRLVERAQKKVMMTAIGDQVADIAQEMLASAQKIEEVCRRSEALLEGQIVLGVIPTVAPYYLPKLLPALHQAYPKLRLYLKEDQTEKLSEMLENGEIDVALLALPVDDKFAEKVIFEEDFVVALPVGHPLTKKDQITVKDVQKEGLMLLEEGHCLREQALEVCKMLPSSKTDGADFRATSLETLKHMVSSGLGVTLLPQFAVDEGQGYVTKPFKDPVPTRKIGLLFRRTSPRKAEIALFAKTLEGILKRSR